ncbi:hypothetical protein BH10PLA2_BH10PLA2_20190 [soil metagenome]
MSKSTANAGKSNDLKPSKPYPDFPRFPHVTKRWAKKIRGKMHYFGPWEDPDGALAGYWRQKDALHRGLTPADTSEGLNVFTLAAKFLTTKKQSLTTGELSVHSFRDYTNVCKLLVRSFGKNRLVIDLYPSDF